MENELYERWDEILERMKVDFDISDVSYRTFIKKLSLYGVKDNTITILIDDTSIGSNSKQFIEQKYNTFLSVAIEEVTNVHYELTYISLTELDAKNSTNMPEKEEKKVRLNPSINPNYTFDTFIVGDNNDYAHAASLKVAEEPGDTYNPLFIYGGAGLGKTHLMHAIANYILEHDKTKKVVYVTSETFTNEIVDAVRDSKNEHSTARQDFRNKYRTVDVLLIDDIQFIEGKEATQLEFFHTFNALHSAGKQIILTSDKPPKDMETLEDRIRSRFEWGLIADIGTPDYETRMAILRRKVEADDMKLSDEILNYIATNIKSNIRELEGALNKLLAYSNLEKTDITMEIAMKELQNIITPDKPREITPQLVIEVVTEHFNISLDQMISKNRSNEIARPRQIAMYLCKNMTDIPLDSIGQLLGGRDHSTIIHGIKKIADEYESNENTRNLIETIKKKINPN